MAKSEWPDWNVYVRDRCRCAYCGLDGSVSFDFWKHLSIDHIVPTTHGGSDEPENKVVACKRCNEKLGAENPEGDSREDRIDWKRRRVSELLAEEQIDFARMTAEF